MNHPDSSTPRLNRWVFLVAALLFAFVSIITSQAQTTIQATLPGGGALPAGWTSVNGVTTEVIDKGTYWLVEPGASKDYIVTGDYNLTVYSTITVNVNVATFGSGSNLPMLIEYSADSGSTWNSNTFTSATPTSSTYITGGPITITGPFTSTTRLRFSANGTSGRGVRIQKLGITGLVAGLPTITSIAPETGWVGTSVTITGTNLSNVTAVKFNGSDAASFTLDTDTQITCTAPSGVTTGKISVTNPSGTAQSTADFTSINPNIPTISSFTPTTGWDGTSVTITGTALTGATAVTFAGTPAASFTVDNATQITASAPAGVTTGFILVTTPEGSAESNIMFTALNPNLPTISGFTPTTGWVGTEVIITGTHFSDVNDVSFNSASASFTVNSATQITAIVPSDVSTGLITVTTLEGTAESADDFLAINPNLPTIASFAPAIGWTGDTVVITGTNFTGATEVSFHYTTASYTVDSATQITATVPSGVSTGLIEVTTPEGTAESATAFDAVNPNTLAVTLNAATVLENATNPATTGTVTRGGSTVAELTVTLTSSAIGRITVPATVVIPAGESSVNFDVTVVNNNIPDSNSPVTLTATADGYANGSNSLSVQDDGDTWPVVISQYYEGLSNDKYIELHNISGADFTLTGFRLTVWNEAKAENWKTATGSPNSSQDLSSITIPAGSYYLFKASAAANPAYAATNANMTSAATSFNGNDSVVLYSSSTYATSNIVDAISLTDSGNQGADKSFYRLTNDQGYDLTSGSSIMDFPAVWGTKTLPEVASATSTDDWYLNYYTVAQTPVLATFTVGNSAAITASGRATLNFTSTGGNPLEYRVSELADLSDATWQPLATLNTYNLSAVAGTKTVYFQLKNTTGESAILSDTIDRVDYIYGSGVLITQYYDPSSGSHKYLELTNTSANPVDLTGWSIGRWTNQDAENWKITGTSVTTSPSATISLTSIGTLAAGQTVVIAHTGAAALTPPAALLSGNLDQTGNDSLALYSGTPSPATLVDVISFTNLGNEGADRSFVRLNNSQGFSFAAGSNATNFPAVWRDTALAVVDAAGATTNEKLGVYPGSAASGYDDWKSVVGNQTADLDYDGDGLDNGTEYFMGTAGNVFTQNPGIVGGAVTWPRASGTTIAAWRIEVSTDLVHWENSTVNHAGSLNTSDTAQVVFTMPATPGKFFVRLSVQP